MFVLLGVLGKADGAVVDGEGVPAYAGRGGAGASSVPVTAVVSVASV